MAALLLILAVLGIVVVANAVLENTAPMTVTLFGQELSGLNNGEWLAAAAGLGFLVMLFLALAMGISRRRRLRRDDVRSNEELADRVAELERENFVLRRNSATDGATRTEERVRRG
jgi:ribosomal protein L29